MPWEKIGWMTLDFPGGRPGLTNAGTIFLRRLMERGWLPAENKSIKRGYGIELRDHEELTVAKVGSYEDLSRLAAALEPTPEEFLKVMGGMLAALKDGWNTEFRDDKLHFWKWMHLTAATTTYADLAMFLHEHGYLKVSSR